MSVRRVFMSTINYSHLQSGMIHAFEGIFGKENVAHYDYLSRLKVMGKDAVNAEFVEKAVAFKPDMTWLQLQNSEVITANAIDDVRGRLPKCTITHWCGDVRENVGDYFASICKATHLTLVANVGFIPKYEEAGAEHVMYVPHGLDWNEDVMGLPPWEPPFQVPDVVYCGNHYGGNMVGSEIREAAVRALHEAKIRIGIVGSGWEKTGLPILGQCHVKQQVQVYRRAKVILSVNHFPDLAGYHGDRTITAMASGTAVVQRYFPGLEDEFVDGMHLCVYQTSRDIVEKVLALLDDEPRRLKLGANGRREVILHHTWFSRIFQVLSRVEELQRTL